MGQSKAIQAYDGIGTARARATRTEEGKSNEDEEGQNEYESTLAQ